jgi:hypothetical protein
MQFIIINHQSSAPLARRDRAPLQAIQLAELLSMSLSVSVRRLIGGDDTQR